MTTSQSSPFASPRRGVALVRTALPASLPSVRPQKRGGNCGVVFVCGGVLFQFCDYSLSRDLDEKHVEHSLTYGIIVDRLIDTLVDNLVDDWVPTFRSHIDNIDNTWRNIQDRLMVDVGSSWSVPQVMASKIIKMLFRSNLRRIEDGKTWCLMVGMFHVHGYVSSLDILCKHRSPCSNEFRADGSEMLGLGNADSSSIIDLLALSALISRQPQAGFLANQKRIIRITVLVFHDFSLTMQQKNKNQ